MNLKYVIITPQYAQELLSKNTGNRKLRKSVVNTYARDIENGNWVTGGHDNQIDPICVAKSGRLLNGQHRLSAIVQVNKPVRMWIQTDMNEDAFRFMDNGLKRSPADAAGEGFTNDDSALARVMFATKNSETSSFDVLIDGRIARNGGAWVQPTKADIIGEMKENEETIKRAVRLGKATKSAVGVGTVKIYAYFYWLIEWLERDEMLETFANALSTSKVTDCTQAEAFKSYMLRYFNKKEPSIRKKYQLASLLVAYDALLKDKKIESIKSIDAAMKKYPKLIQEKRVELYGESNETNKEEMER